MATTVDLPVNSFIALLAEEVHHFKNDQMCATFYSLFTRSCPGTFNMLEGGQFSKKFSENIIKLAARHMDECEVLHLELFFLIGFVRSNTNPPLSHINSLGDCILSRLSSSPFSLIVMAITLAELWWASIINLCPIMEDSVFDLATKICLRVLFHIGSDDRSVSHSAKSFMNYVLTSFISLPNSNLRSWVMKRLVGEAIISHPVTLRAPTIPSKGALRCFLLVLKHFGLNEVFSLSPHLTTSLLISIGHNYTAATAASVLLELFNS